MDWPDCRPPGRSPFFGEIFPRSKDRRSAVSWPNFIGVRTLPIKEKYRSGAGRDAVTFSRALPTQAEIKYLKHAPLADFRRSLSIAPRRIFPSPFHPPRRAIRLCPSNLRCSFLFARRPTFPLADTAPANPSIRDWSARWVQCAPKEEQDRREGVQEKSSAPPGGERVSAGLFCEARCRIARIREGAGLAAAHRQETHYIWQRFHSARLSLFSPGRFSWHRAGHPSGYVSSPPRRGPYLLARLSGFFLLFLSFARLPRPALRSRLPASFLFVFLPRVAATSANANHRYLPEPISADRGEGISPREDRIPRLHENIIRNGGRRDPDRRRFVARPEADAPQLAATRFLFKSG